MDKNYQSKKSLPTYTAPKDIMDSLQLEENNEVVEDLNKKISESTKTRRANSKFRREISPERVDPLQSLSRQGKNQNLNQRNYKDIMLAQANLAKEAERKSNQYNNINYNSRTLNQKSRRDNNETNSVFTKETRMTSVINKYEKSINDDFLSRKRNKSINENEEYAKDEPSERIINNIKNEQKEKSEVILSPKKNLIEKTNNNKDEDSSENYDIPTPKNESESDSEVTIINEKQKEESEAEKNYKKENKSAKEEEEEKNEKESIIPEKFNFEKNDKIKEELKYNYDFIERNRPLTDEEINAILPGEKEGYQIVPPPIKYQQFIDSYIAQKKQKYSTDPMLSIPKFSIPEDDENKKLDATMYNGLKPEDREFFQTLFDPEVDETKLSLESIKKRRVLIYLLKIKNGIPPVRKSALRQITDKAKYFGPSNLFSQIIPLLMSPSLDDEERHSLVKLMKRLLLKLGAEVRPWTHKILVAVTPMLVDEIAYVRIEGRELISNLSKSVGMPVMISVLRPDIESLDESIRTITAKSLAIVASSLGVNEFFPFLKAINETKKNWTIRETGIKVVQQLAMLIGNGVLPYLSMLIEIIKNGLKRENEHQKVKIHTALAISALAEASYPYGIDFYNEIIKYLFDGIKVYKGKLLASYFKAIGNIIVLMDDEVATRSAKNILPILKKDFISPDENIRRVILNVLKQCLLVNGIDYSYVKEEISGDFFSSFWNRRMALDRKNYKGVIDVTVEIAKKISCSEVLNIIVYYLKDENEIFRKMTLECVEKIIAKMGVIDIDKRLEQLLVDGLMLCFEEQNTDDSNNNNSNDIVLSCFGQVVTSLE